MSRHLNHQSSQPDLQPNDGVATSRGAKTEWLDKLVPDWNPPMPDVFVGSYRRLTLSEEKGVKKGQQTLRRESEEKQEWNGSTQKEVLTMSLDRKLLNTWCRIGDSFCLNSHSQIAEFLLHSYQEKAYLDLGKKCVTCGCLMSWKCVACLTKDPLQLAPATTVDNSQSDLEEKGREQPQMPLKPSQSLQHKPQSSEQLQVQPLAPILRKGQGQKQQIKQARKSKTLIRRRKAKSKKREDPKSNLKKTKSASRRSQDSRLNMIIRESDDEHYDEDETWSPVRYNLEDSEDFEDSGDNQAADSISPAFFTHNEDAVNICPVCSKHFATLKLLKTHMYTHSEKKPHVCDVCSKAFRFAYMLKKHKLLHTGQKNFVCNVCSKAFAKNDYLKTHMMSHTGLRPHVCDVCGKAFSMACNLKKHKLIHGGIRPHVCGICQKAFTQAGDLKQHSLIHTGQKPHVCDQCGKAFRYCTMFYSFFCGHW